MTRTGYGSRYRPICAAYPIYDGDGRPAWQGVIVVEPAGYLWRCPQHVHYEHGEAVACAEQEFGDALAGVLAAERERAAEAGRP